MVGKAEVIFLVAIALKNARGFVCGRVELVVSKPEETDVVLPRSRMPSQVESRRELRHRTLHARFTTRRAFDTVGEIRANVSFDP